MADAVVRVAQVGCGYWGKNLVRNFHELGALCAVSDSSETVAAAMGATYGVPARSFEALLASADVDAVSLATPAPTHAEMAIRALKAGKHVFVEKPLSLDLGDARAMIEAAAAADRRLMVGHLLQHHPAFLTLKAAVADGAIGALRYVYSNRLSMGRIRTEENVLWSFAPHDISMLLSVVDEALVSVSARGAAVVTPGVADWCHCDFAFSSGLKAHVQAAWLHPFKEQRFVVVGALGSIVFEDSAADPTKKLALYKTRVETTGPVPVAVGAQPEYLEVPPGEPLRLECAHFLDSIIEGRPPRTDGAEGLRVLEALTRAESSLATYLARGTDD